MPDLLVIAAVPTRFDNGMFAVLAILAVALAMSALVTYLFGTRQGSTSGLAVFVGKSARPLAAAIACVAMLGSLYYSEVRHFEPCRWCWYQRICWYPLAVILVISVLRKDPNVRRYAWPMATVGLVIASYHHVIERYPDLADESSCSAIVPCSSPYFRVWGQFTIAAMSVMGLVSILVLLLIDRSWSRRQADSKEHV